MEPSKYEPLLDEQRMLRVLLCQGAYTWLQTNGGIPGDAEAEEAKQQAELDGNWEAFAAAAAASQQAELDAWAASKPGRTHLQCARRWHRKNIRPTFQEAKTIVRPLLAAVPTLSRNHPQGPLRAESWFSSGRFQDRDMQMLRYFIQDSKSDPVYWNALEIICERLGESGEDMPPELMKWRLETLERKRKRKRPKGQPGAPSLIGRDLVIWETIAALKRLGMFATRNDAAKQQESACDAVAEISGLDFSTVKKIWLKYTRRRRRGAGR